MAGAHAEVGAGRAEGAGSEERIRCTSIVPSADCSIGRF